jgi:tetratricopeptide (TPR) repeat protein
MPRTLTTRWLLAGLLALPGAAAAQESSSAATTLRSSPASIEVSSSAADAHMVAGLASYWRLRLPEAERHFRAAVEAAPQSAATHYYRGYAIYEAEPKRPNDPGKRRAAEEFAEAYAIDPGFRPGWGIHGI